MIFSWLFLPHLEIDAPVFEVKSENIRQFPYIIDNLYLDNLIKRYQTTNFINKLTKARQFSKRARIYFYRLLR